MMIDLGEDLNWIKHMLGHADLKMIFERYGNRINRETTSRKKVNFGKLISSK